jgi:hypothetical protein
MLQPTTNGIWEAQERKLRIKLAQAMVKVHLASDKRACHTLWTAKLSLHDAASVLPYYKLDYMGASDLSEAFLNTMLTALVEATRIRCTLGTHVARERLCGPVGGRIYRHALYSTRYAHALTICPVGV